METATKIDPDFDLEVERNYRYNAAVNILDGTFFWFGASFIGLIGFVLMRWSVREPRYVVERGV